ncbi:MAG: putative secreted protein [Fibrobacteres bacterium]|nr:putative secreted protein [Fibrobacterota bacterium]
MPQSRYHLLLAAAVMLFFGRGLRAQSIGISGIVTDSAGTPISGAGLRLENAGLTATTGADGRFSLATGTAIHSARPQEAMAVIREGSLFLSLPEKSDITITAYGLRGNAVSSIRRRLEAGSHSVQPPGIGSGVCFYRIASETYEIVVRAVSIEGALRSASANPGSSAPQSLLAKSAASAAALYDIVSAAKSGFQKAYVSVTASDASDLKIKMIKEGAPKFSYFVTSMKAMQSLSGSQNGFGGDFRFGETGPGAGLRGADKICAAIAERSMPGASVKGWRAFLSVTADTYGKKVNAIDRIGEGPWYDRLGRVMAPTRADLLFTRPRNGDPIIQVDLPNEDGIPNHRPDPTQPIVDNHHTVTGSDSTGKLKSTTSTCKDWTTSDGSSVNGKPSCGFSWPRSASAVGGNKTGQNWISTWDAPGCAAGFEIVDAGVAPPGSIIIGGGGGYGGFYCFALNP